MVQLYYRHDKVARRDDQSVLSEEESGEEGGEAAWPEPPPSPPGEAEPFQVGSWSMLILCAARRG